MEKNFKPVFFFTFCRGKTPFTKRPQLIFNLVPNNPPGEGTAPTASIDCYDFQKCPQKLIQPFF